MDQDKRVYQMTCGCRLTKNQLKRRPFLGCPTHKDGKIQHVEYPCEDCGKLLIRKSPSSRVRRCPPCQDAWTKKNNKEGRERRKKDPNYVGTMRPLDDRALASADRWDCKHRDDCLTKSFTDPYLKCLPCKDCDRYVPEKIKMEIIGDSYELYRTLGLTMK